MHRLALLLLASLSLAACSASQREADARQGASLAVSEENLLESDRFWPYQLALTEAWQPTDGGRTLRPGTLGVLIRVESEGAARIDFGRHGRHPVPVAATDLLARANRIRRGELEKRAPNFVLAVGTRLLDPAAGALRPYRIGSADALQVILCVFADPAGDALAELAAALASLQARGGVLTLLFPMGGHPDAQVGERLRALGWAIPFVMGPFVAPYSRSLLGAPAQAPTLLLQTPEGRLLLREDWSAQAPAALRAALDGATARSSLRAGAPG